MWQVLNIGFLHMIVGIKGFFLMCRYSCTLLFELKVIKERLTTRYYAEIYFGDCAMYNEI